MSEQAAPQRFGTVAIALHWIVAGAVVGTVALALYLDTLELGETKNLMLTAHKSVGLTILALMALRVVWRLTHRAPPLPATMTAWQRWAAQATHIFLYVIALAMPVTGYMSVAARGRETTFFGLFRVPEIVPLDRALSNLSENLHTNGQYVLYALVGAHVAGALYHHFIAKDDILRRMWPQGRR
ncbi:MAG: cytochrome b [Rhodospirillaceae bacterium]|nr:cytochrome b [Rhodospirillaceae bacterium]